MSARIAPEPVSIGITNHVDFHPRAVESTRPVEPTESISADKREDNPRNGDNPRSAAGEARPPDRPPGKDPSIPPQSLFDAALIAAEFKAGAVLAELAADEQLKEAEDNATVAKADHEQELQKEAAADYRADEIQREKDKRAAHKQEIVEAGIRAADSQREESQRETS